MAVGGWVEWGGSRGVGVGEGGVLSDQLDSTTSASPAATAAAATSPTGTL